MWRAFAGGVAFAIALGGQVALADGPLGAQKNAVTNVTPWLDVEFYAGYLTGRSREIVYDPASGQRISQLNWDIKSAGVFGGNVAIKPSDWSRIRFGGWIPLVSNNHMEDYDWLIAPFVTPSHVSVHPDMPSACAGYRDPTDEPASPRRPILSSRRFDGGER